jgi:hypothetical protein
VGTSSCRQTDVKKFIKYQNELPPRNSVSRGTTQFAYNRCVHSSKSFKVYKESVGRLNVIAQPLPAAVWTNLQEMAKDLKTYQLEKSSSAPLPKDDLEEFVRLQMATLERAQHLSEYCQTQVNALSSKVLLYNWLFAILATAAEVYFEHALAELLSATLSSSLLPSEVLDGIQKNWIKNLLRSKPGAWLTALKNMGAGPFPATLGSDMYELWEKRHHTVHSEQSLKTNLEEFEKALKLVDTFVDITDAFVVTKLTEAKQLLQASSQTA